MYAFGNWHAYFDSLFITSASPSSLFLQQIKISAAPNGKWCHSSTLPLLFKQFQSLQKFIFKPSNWRLCSCDELEIRIIQSKLDRLVLLLSCEKVYAKQYWELDSRRVQASFVHLFIILRQFIEAIIPKGLISLKETINQDKLCMQLPHFKKLINFFLQSLETAHVFMFSPAFENLAAATVQLFQQITYFWKKLPTITVQELKKTPRLMRVICLENSLQSNRIYGLEGDHVRKKSETIMTVKKTISSSRSSGVKKQNENSDILDDIKFIKESKEDAFFGGRVPSQRSHPDQHIFFKFTKNLCRRDTFQLEKKTTVTTIHSKEKSLSIGKDSRKRSTTIDPGFTILTKSKTYQKISHKNNKILLNSQRSNERRLKKVKELLEYREEEVQRVNYKKIKWQNIQVNHKLRHLSQMINLATGKTKGWAVIRQYLFKKIAERKLKTIVIW